MKAEWPDFVKYKESAEAKARSETNKANAKKKNTTKNWGQVATRVLCLSGKLWRPT